MDPLKEDFLSDTFPSKKIIFKKIKGKSNDSLTRYNFFVFFPPKKLYLFLNKKLMFWRVLHAQCAQLFLHNSARFTINLNNF